MATPRWCFAAGNAELPFLKSDPSCPLWPPYRTSRSELPHVLDSSIERTLSAMPAVGDGDLQRLSRLPCVRRQCLRVQILRGRVFVVAPHSKRCAKGGQGPCSVHARQRTDGVAMSDGGAVGKWDKKYSPTMLEWDFATGVNVSNCAGTIVEADEGPSKDCHRPKD